VSGRRRISSRFVWIAAAVGQRVVDVGSVQPKLGVDGVRQRDGRRPKAAALQPVVAGKDDRPVGDVCRGVLRQRGDVDAHVSHEAATVHHQSAHHAPGDRRPVRHLLL